MTDKVQKVREEVERLMYGFNLEADIASCEDAETEKLADIKCQLCKKILEYIDSLQEEPQVKESTKTQHIKETCKVNGNSLTQEPVSEQDLSKVGRIGKDWKEPVSEVLEAAIDTYLVTYFGGEKEKQDWPFLKKIAIHFATWQKQQIMAKAFDFTNEHNIACVLASECLRNHGWFNRERVFNNLFRHLACVDKLFEGKFSGKTKVIVIKED